jgi:hypothetical protein
MTFGTQRLQFLRGAISRSGRMTLLALSASAALLQSAPGALALSEIRREELPFPGAPDTTTPPRITLPSPEEPGTEEPASGDDGNLDQARPDVEDDEPIPEIMYNLDRLPEPVRRMHDLIVDAAKSGDVEKLRPLIGLGDAQTQLSLGGIDGDPIAFLKSLSGDQEGQEILAILEEVLNAGFVHLEAGTPQELYVWPYFFGVPLDKLDARQKVELFKIVTAGDYEDMKTFGTYIFYRVGIDPTGRWSFFVAGD